MQLQTPGSRDAIVFDESAPEPGNAGGEIRIWSKLQDPPNPPLPA